MKMTGGAQVVLGAGGGSQETELPVLELMRSHRGYWCCSLVLLAPRIFFSIVSYNESHVTAA